MKKIYLLLISILSIIHLNGQIILTAETSIPAPGSVFDYVRNNSFQTLDVGNSGANVTWDLSSLSGPNYQVEYPAAANTHFKILFPEASIAEVGFHSKDNIFKVTDSSISYVGHFGNGDIIKYADERAFLKFPLAYNSTYIDSFSGTIESHGFVHTRTGAVEIKADGYGSLILPYGTVENVIRIVVVTKYKDQWDNTQFSNYIDSVYLWYNLHTSNKIASYSIRHDGQGWISYLNAVYLSESNINTGVDELVKNNFINVFPNPASDRIIIENHERINQIQIHDINGRFIRNIEVVSKEIDIKELDSGIYIIKINTPEGTMTKKLSVVR